MDFDSTRLFHRSNSNELRLYNKQFTNALYVKGDLVIENPYNVTKLLVQDFNQHKNLPNIMSSAILDTKPIEFENLVIFEDGIGADNLIVHELIDNEGFENVRYDHRFNLTEIFLNVMALKSGVINSIIVKGNVTFTKFPPIFNGVDRADTFVGVLNGVNVSEYFNLVVAKPTASGHKDKVPAIGGIKSFNDLQVSVV